MGARPIALLISNQFAPQMGGSSSVAWNRAMITHKSVHSPFALCSFLSYPAGRVADPRYKRKLLRIESLGPIHS
jgi:hypothetical protein